MSMHQFIKLICLKFQAVPPVLQVGKLSNYKKRESLFYKYQDKVTQIQMEEVNHIYMTMQSRHVKR